MKRFRKTLFQTLRVVFVFAFILSWEFSAWPSLFSFPPKVQEAQAAVNFVQENFQKVAAQTISVTPNLTYAGDLLVVVADWDQSRNLSSISDTEGNLYATALGPISWSSNNVTQMFYAKNIKGGANTVTVTLNGSSVNLSLDVVEYSGANTVSPLDATSVGTGNGTALDSGSVSASSGNELVFGYGDLSFGNTTLIAGNGFVPRKQFEDNNKELSSEDKYVTSAGLNNATATGGGSADWIMMMAAFKSAPLGGGISQRSDTLSDSRPSATSNHAFSFTANSAISGSSTLTFAFPAGFNLGGLDCGDVNAATGSPFNFNYPSCAPTATAWGAQVKAVITNVQFAGASNGASNTISDAFSTNNTAGNLIVAVVQWDGTSISVSSITDTNGNTYTSALGPVNWKGLAPGNRAQIFYAKNILGGANTVTVTLTSAAVSNIELYIHEYSGADTVSPLDAAISATSDSGTAMDSGFATTHNANELIFGAGFTGTVSTPGAGFTTRSTFDSNMTEDKSATSVGSYDATETSGSGGAWIMMMATFKAAGSGAVLTLTAPTDSRVHVATTTPMTIWLGTNATTTRQGIHTITNPSTAGVYTISLGGTSGNSGNILVSINGPVIVSATIPESLAFTVSSVAAVNCTADDGATVNKIATTTSTVPFGTLSSANTFYQGCQDLIVSTNSGGGYSLTSWESSALLASGGQTIPDTKCDNGLCNAVTSAPWATATNNGFGHTCLDQSGHDCGALYGEGTKFRQFANIAGATGGIGLVQRSSATGVAASIGLAYPQNNTAGDLLVVAAGNDTAGGAMSISDSLGNVYTVATSINSSVGSSVVTIWYVANAKPGANTVTVSNESEMQIYEYAGITNTFPLDQFGTASGTLTSAISITSVGATIQANELVFAFGYDDCGNRTFSAGNGYTLEENTRSALGFVSSGGEDKISSGAGVQNATLTIGSGSDCWAAAMATFKASQSGGEALMSSSTPAIATGRIKFRLSVGSQQPAGVYSNTVDYILEPTY
jgi:hypothetical protein